MSNLAWTYDTLFAALQAWPVDDSDQYIEQIPTIIGLGELRLVRDLNLEIFDTTDTSKSTVVGTRTITKPTTSVVMRDVGIIIATGYKPLENRSVAYCKMYAPLTSAQAEPVYWYEKSTTEIELVPTPDAIYVVHQHIVQRPSDSLALALQGPSWLSRCVPDALFAACLMESEQYLKADDRYNNYKTKYYEELLPVARLELRAAIRNGDYMPLKSAAVTQ